MKTVTHNTELTIIEQAIVRAMVSAIVKELRAEHDESPAAGKQLGLECAVETRTDEVITIQP